MIDKIKICSIINDLGIGGTARQLVTIDKYLNKIFFEHMIISLGSTNDVRARYFNNKKIFFVNTASEVAELIKNNQIDVLYFQRHGRNEKIHDYIVKKIPKNILLAELNTFSVFDPGVFGRRCDLHLFVSCINLLKYIKQNNLLFNFNNQKVVYGLIDSNNFKNYLPSEQEKIEYIKKYNLNNFFVVGRLARPVLSKWDDRTIIFWKHLSKLNPNIKFIIYGVPEEKRKLLIASGRADNLIILEQTSSDKELAIFYSIIDIFVHMSPIGECNCGTIAEAMLFGKPVVVTSTPFPKRTFFRTHTKDNGQLEQIKNGKNGYVVNNALAMARAVDYLSKHVKIREIMGQVNQLEITKKYDVSVGIKTLEKTFIEGLGEKGLTLSNELLSYANDLFYYPSKTDIEGWFVEYYKRLKDVYCRGCFSFKDETYSVFLILLRKIKTVLKLIVNKV